MSGKMPAYKRDAKKQMFMKDRRIAIVGCGWLGLPMGEKFKQEGAVVKGSTTRREKLPELASHGIAPHLLELDPDLQAEQADDLLRADVLILTIPPGRRRENVIDFYRRALQQLSDAVERVGEIRHIIYTSSTGVYGNIHGHVDESSQPAPDRASAHAVLEAEKLLRDRFGNRLTILRLGGLVGGQRHPARMLAGRTDLPSGDSWVNLVHRDDVIEVIRAVITRDAWGKLYNVVTPHWAAKAAYYPWAARQMGLEPPVYSDDHSITFGRMVDSRLLMKDLNYLFRYRELWDFPLPAAETREDS